MNNLGITNTPVATIQHVTEAVTVEKISRTLQVNKQNHTVVIQPKARSVSLTSGNSYTNNNAFVQVQTYNDLPPVGSTLPPNNVIIVREAILNRPSGLYLDTGTEWKYLGNPRFIFTQNIASTTWDITHELGYFPNGQSFDNAGNLFWGEIRQIDVNNMQMLFNKPIVGIATLS